MGLKQCGGEFPGFAFCFTFPRCGAGGASTPGNFNRGRQKYPQVKPNHLVKGPETEQPSKTENFLIITALLKPNITKKHEASPLPMPAKLSRKSRHLPSPCCSKLLQTPSRGSVKKGSVGSCDFHIHCAIISLASPWSVKTRRQIFYSVIEPFPLLAGQCQRRPGRIRTFTNGQQY